MTRRATLAQAAVLMLPTLPLPAQSTLTTLTGTIRDLSGAPVTSGRIAFTTTLAPGQDLTIPGVARFVPTTVYCGIDATGTPRAMVNGTVTSAACQITSNTALSPAGTSYIINIQPYSIAPGSFVNFFALAGQTVDISTIAPTPGKLPTNYTGVQGPPGCIVGTSNCSALFPNTTNVLQGTGGGNIGPTALSDNGTTLAYSRRYLRLGSAGMGEWPGNPSASQDPGFRISNTYDDSNVYQTPGFSHGMSIDDLFGRSGTTCAAVYSDGCAYAVYDTRMQLFGANSTNHIVGYQMGAGTRNDWSGPLGHFSAFEADPIFNGTGTVQNYSGFVANNIQYTATPTIVNVKGFEAADITSGGYAWNFNSGGIVYPFGTRFGVYVHGNPSYFGGPLLLQLNNTTNSTIAYTGGVGFSFKNLLDGPQNYFQGDMQAGPDADGAYARFAVFPKSFTAGGSVLPLEASWIAQTGLTNGMVLGTNATGAGASLRFLAGGSIQAAVRTDGGMQLSTTASPACDATHAGTFFYTAGAAGVKDTVQVCAKDATNAYALRTIY